MSRLNRWTSALLLLASVALLSLAVTVTADSTMYASALTMQVEPRTQSCFYEDLQKDSTFRLEFEVVRGGLLDVKLRITDPVGGTVVDKIAYFNKEDDAANESEGRINFVALHTGRYTICFDNTMSRWTAKVVSFFVLNDQPGGQSGAESKSAVAKLADLGPTVDSVIKIADELDAIETLQRHMRRREQSHRDATLSTNARVQWLALLESVLLVTLTAFQIHWIRHWFAETSTRGRV